MHKWFSVVFYASALMTSTAYAQDSGAGLIGYSEDFPMSDEIAAPYEFVGLGKIAMPLPITEIIPINQNSCDYVSSIPDEGYYPEMLKYDSRPPVKKPLPWGTWTCFVDYEDRRVPEFRPLSPLCYDYGVICYNEDGDLFPGIRCLTADCGVKYLE